MRFLPYVISSALILSVSSLADTLKYADPEAILSIAKGHGRAELSQDEFNDPQIKGRINGNKYRIIFYDCTEGKNCQTFAFDAAWEVKGGIDSEQTNKWNQNKRFGRAFVDSEGDAGLDWDINLSFGLEADNLDDTFKIWGDIMQEYAEYIRQ